MFPNKNCPRKKRKKANSKILINFIAKMSYIKKFFSRVVSKLYENKASGQIVIGKGL